MKKIIFLLLLFIAAVSTQGYSQKNTSKAYATSTSNITLGYGIGNFWTVFLDKVIEIPDYKVSSLGPFTLLYEYGISKRFNTGIALSYSRARGKAERFQIADQITFYSVILRANYHFFTGAKLDPYIGAGVGISNSKYKNLDEHTVGNYNSKAPNTFEPNAQLGIKYFPLKRFGVCAEIGYVGGALGLIGITTKF